MNQMVFLKRLKLLIQYHSLFNSIRYELAPVFSGAFFNDMSSREYIINEIYCVLAFF